MGEHVEQEQAELLRALQTLSRDEGVWRPNLAELLGGELRPLQLTWHINLESAPDIIRRVVEMNLGALIAQLSPRTARQPLSIEQRQEQYRTAVRISFNISTRPELRGLKLQERRAWLASEKLGPRRTAISISQRDLNHAIEQMATLLTRPDYEPTSSVEDQGLSASIQGAEIEPPAEREQKSIAAVAPSSPSMDSKVDSLARRLAIELRAARALLARTVPKVGRAVKRRALWLIVTTSVALIVAYLSGLLMGRVTGNPPWFGPFRSLGAFFYEHRVPVGVTFALLAAGVIPWSIFLRRGKMIAYITASLLVLHECLVGAVLIARDQELKSADKLYGEVATWSQGQVLRFEGKPIEGDPYKDICKEFKPLLPFDIANKLVASKLAVPYGEELHGDLCASGRGDVILRSGMDSNSLPGNKAQDHDARVYAEALVRPSLGTLWSDCGMLAVPGYRTEGKSILAFGLEVTDDAKLEYRPIISLITLEEEKVVARSAVTIPTPDEIGQFFGAPRDGWLKFGVHRTGATYNFYVNDREVVSYTLDDGEKWIHMSLASRVEKSRLGRAIAECHFDDFRYWTQPVSSN